ncbi:hypothetical protein GN956_G1997 [Arapaima gigas]
MSFSLLLHQPSKCSEGDTQGTQQTILWRDGLQDHPQTDDHVCMNQSQNAASRRKDGCSEMVGHVRIVWTTQQAEDDTHLVVATRPTFHCISLVAEAELKNRKGTRLLWTSTPVSF